MEHHIKQRTTSRRARPFLGSGGWEDVNLEKLIDYEICVHVFGGSVSMYHALRRTALDNVSSYRRIFQIAKTHNVTFVLTFSQGANLAKVPKYEDFKTL